MHKTLKRLLNNLLKLATNTTFVEMLLLHNLSLKLDGSNLMEVLLSTSIKFEPSSFNDRLCKSNISTNVVFVANFNKLFSNLFNVLCIWILGFNERYHFLCTHNGFTHNVMMTFVRLNRLLNRLFWLWLRCWCRLWLWSRFWNFWFWSFYHRIAFDS